MEDIKDDYFLLSWGGKQIVLDTKGDLEQISKAFHDALKGGHESQNKGKTMAIYAAIKAGLTVFEEDIKEQYPHLKDFGFNNPLDCAKLEHDGYEYFSIKYNNDNLSVQTNCDPRTLTTNLVRYFRDKIMCKELEYVLNLLSTFKAVAGVVEDDLSILNEHGYDKFKDAIKQRDSDIINGQK